MLELKKDKGIDYVISWKSKRLCCSKFRPLHTAFLRNMNFSGYRMGIKFDENPLAVEQKNYPTKVANAFIVYDLNAGPKVPLNNFELKNWLFDATNIVKK